MQNGCKFDHSKQNHILLLPGLMAPVTLLFPLVRYLRKNQGKYGVTAIPLGLSLKDFDTLVNQAFTNISKNLLEMSRPDTIILFGHSHGGRVACELVRRLKASFPEVEYTVVTAGSPMSTGLSHFSFLHLYFSFSKAYRTWPQITQPDSSVVRKYIGYYSTDDSTVPPKLAKIGHIGELIELQGLSHHDLISPFKMGPRILKLLV